MSFPGEDLCPAEYRQFFHDMYTRVVVLISTFAFKALETAPALEGGTPYLAASMIHKETSFPFLVNVTTMDMADCILGRNYNKFLEKVRSVYDSLCYKTGADTVTDAVTDVIDDAPKNVIDDAPKNIMSKLLDGFHDCFKENVLFMMDKEGIHDMKLLVGNEVYSKTFCEKLEQFGSVASKILFDRLMMTTPKQRTKKRSLELFEEPCNKEAMKTKIVYRKTQTFKSVVVSDVTFYTPSEIAHFRHNPERLCNKFRIIGYDEEGNIDLNAPFVCIPPSKGNSAMFLATKSKSVFRVPGIYHFATYNSTPLDFVAEKFHSVFKESS